MLTLEFFSSICFLAATSVTVFIDTYPSEESYSFQALSTSNIAEGQSLVKLGVLVRLSCYNRNTIA